MEENKDSGKIFCFWKTCYLKSDMKIVYCLPSTWRLGGIERIISLKANLLSEMGHEVVIITTDQRGLQPYFHLSEKVKCYDLNINYDKNSNRRFIEKLKYFFYNSYIHKKRLEKLLLELHADIVISTFFNEMSILPHLKDGSKKIVEIHFSRYLFRFSRRSGIKGYIDDFSFFKSLRLLRKYSRFIVLSNEDAGNWTGLKNVEVINNVCNLRVSKRADLKEKRVIAVGRYEIQKGFDRLINAWSLISKDVPDWTLHIVGEGSLRPVLTKQIKDLGLESSVFLDGATKDIATEYLKSSIAAFTSVFEGFSMALVEAESAGLPVVSFDIPCGPKDIIRDGEDGFLIPDGDIRDFCEKILLLIKNNELREEMGEKAFKNSKRFTVENIMPKWITLFETVLKE